MKDTDYNKLHELSFDGVGWLPANQNAMTLRDQQKNGQSIMVKEVSSRDINFHKNYMALLRFIWSKLPDRFKSKVDCDFFYTWLKVLKKQYNVRYTFVDGRQAIEYISISFSSMSESEFHDYVRDQITYIYEDVIMVLFDDVNKANKVISDIEDQFQKFFDKL